MASAHWRFRREVRFKVSSIFPRQEQGILGYTSGIKSVQNAPQRTFYDSIAIIVLGLCRILKQNPFGTRCVRIECILVRQLIAV